MAANRHPYLGYWQSPWPGEDGGPARLQAPLGGARLGLAPGERLGVTTRRLTAPTMIILREPGEVFLLRHTVYRSFVGLGTTSRVERIDPVALVPLGRSTDLPGGPFWPGGMAAHQNGSLYVVYGTYCHRLGADCVLRGSYRLPQPRPYNSFVILDSGALVMKEFDRAGRIPSHLSVLDPESLLPLCPELTLPETAVARLSARGDTIYVVGVRSVWRYHFDARRGRLELDDTWRIPYLRAPEQSYGWDPVLDEHNVWFMDNGDHGYRYHLRGAGKSRGPVHLCRASLTDEKDWELHEISGRPGGTITNPPIVAPDRNLVVAYDSSHAVLAGWRYTREGGFEPRWCKTSFATANHHLYYASSGELVTQDFDRVRGDDVVVLDIESGAEKARVKTGSVYQAVLFPAPGWQRDFYYVSFSKIARVFIE